MPTRSNKYVNIQYVEFVHPKRAVQRALVRTSNDVGRGLKTAIVGTIDRRNLIKTGNLRQGVGVLVRGNYGVAGIRDVPQVLYSLGPPQIPPGALGIVFMLPLYSYFLEYGTVRMVPRPFFYGSISVVQPLVPEIYQRYLNAELR